MKKRTALCAFLLMVLCLLTHSAIAHSGRTDEDGGHIDHDTGEYHYHHGYPAHKHWDMDGDGKRDCPYTFYGYINDNSNGVYFPKDDVSSTKPKEEKPNLLLGFAETALVYLSVPFMVMLICWGFGKRYSIISICYIVLINGIVAYMIFRILRPDEEVGASLIPAFIFSYVAFWMLKKNCLEK